MIDELIPVIQPAGWAGVEHTVCRPFFEMKDSPLYVSYAIVTPETNLNLTPDLFQESGKTIEELEAESMGRWVERHADLNWEEIEIPGHDQMAMAVSSESDVISSMLLSHGHLKGIQKHFGTEMVQVIIPNRFTVLAHPCPLSIPPLAASLYQEAQADRMELSPYAFQLMEGQIVGYAQPSPESGVAMPSPSASAPAPNDPVEVGVTVLVGAFLLVAAADGTIDEKEVVSFAGQLIAVAAAGSTLAHQACGRIVERNFDPVTAVVEDGFSAVSLMTSIIDAKEAFQALAGEVETEHLRQVARHIARQVAEASGGGFLGLGSKISKDEKAALEVLEGFLR